MGVYIKDMDMPTEKPIAVVIHPDGTAYCAEMLAGVCTEYLNDCVAIPVPPHGRLIDADALAEDLEYDVELDSRILDDMDFVGKEREHIQFDKDCKQKCMRYLTEAPTVIPATAAKEGE